MKRLVITIIVIIVILGMTACGGNTEPIKATVTGFELDLPGTGNSNIISGSMTRTETWTAEGSDFKDIAGAYPLAILLKTQAGDTVEVKFKNIENTSRDVTAQYTVSRKPPKNEDYVLEYTFYNDNKSIIVKEGAEVTVQKVSGKWVLVY